MGWTRWGRAAVLGGVLLAALAPGPAGAVGTVTLDPVDYDFGLVRVGDGASATFTVRAEGDAVTYNGATVPDPPFAVDESGCAGRVLAAGMTCSRVVAFRPIAPGDAGGSLTVSSDGGTATATLAGTGTTGVPGPPPPSQTVPPSSTETTGTTTSPSTSTTSTTSSPSTSPPTSTPETRDECDARAREAEITYQPVREMQVGEQEEVAVLATIGAGVSTTTLPGGGSTTVVPAPLTCQVRARLVGNDFTISPADWTEKSFEGSAAVRWLWSVTPNRSGGPLSLILEVQGLRFDTEAGVFVPAGNAFETTAEIRVTSSAPSFGSRVNGFLTHPVVATVAAAAVVGACGWGFRRVQQRRSASSSRRRPGTGNRPT